MNIFKVAYKNIVHKPANLVLNLLLFALGIGLSLYLFLVNAEIDKSFEKNFAGIDMVIGAKGSDLQVVLSSMYHIDNPTGNIKIGDCKAFLRPDNPLISLSVPLSTGDNYMGFRIIGTDSTMLTLYNATLERGRIFQETGSVVLGAQVAKVCELGLGQKFKSTHGLASAEDLEHEHDLIVTGILAPTGTVIDNLILTSTYTVWDVHSNHDHSNHADKEDHPHHDHSTFSMDRMHLLEHEDEEITNILLKFHNNKDFKVLNLPNNIKKNTAMNAVSPAMILSQFFDQMGLGFKIISWIAIIIAIVSCLSIGISLYSSLEQRKYQLALLRVQGASKGYLTTLILAEGMIMALVGYVFGLVLAYCGYQITRSFVAERFQFLWESFPYHTMVLGFGVISILIGLIASFLPAMKAYRIDIHNLLNR